MVSPAIGKSDDELNSVLNSRFDIEEVVRRLGRNQRLNQIGTRRPAVGIHFGNEAKVRESGMVVSGGRGYSSVASGSPPVASGADSGSGR